MIAARALYPSGGAVTLALALVSGCKSVIGKRAKYAPSAVTQVLAAPTESLQAAIAAKIASEERPKWVTPDRWTRVRALYTQFQNAPLWLERGEHALPTVRCANTPSRGVDGEAAGLATVGTAFRNGVRTFGAIPNQDVSLYQHALTVRARR